MRSYMHADYKLKKCITVDLTRIDINNIAQGIPIKAQVKCTQELEVPYEIIVKLDGEEPKYQ